MCGEIMQKHNMAYLVPNPNPTPKPYPYSPLSKKHEK